MTALASLPRSWHAVDLPGYREAGEIGTYAAFAYDELPPIERPLDDGFRWLVEQPVVSGSLVDVDDAATTPVTSAGLHGLRGAEGLVLPGAFHAFVDSDEPRARIRSSTDCYLDLGQFAVPVEGGGCLVHFLSDSQWVYHWALYAGRDGSEAVVGSEFPLGFEMEEEDQYETVSRFEPGVHDAVVCAESFSEFVYRLWIENEIFFRLYASDADGDLSAEQRRYLEQYRKL